MTHEMSAPNVGLQEERQYPGQETTTEAPQPGVTENSVDTYTSPDETAAGVPQSGALERKAEVQDQKPGVMEKSFDPQTSPDTTATAGVPEPGMPERGADVQHQKPGVTEKSVDTQTLPDDTAGRAPQHKPGMTEKLKLTFANVKDRVTGHGSNTSPTGASGLQQSPGAQATSPSSPGVTPVKPRKDLAERLIDKLPGSHSNPYSTGHYVPPPTPSETLDEDEPPEKGPGFVDKIRTLVTVHKSGRRTTTGNAGSPRKDAYTQAPTPTKDGDLLDKTKDRHSRLKSDDAASDEKWPTPEKPDYHSMPGATYKNEEGHPIEGPTRPSEEDIKKDDIVTKLMDKFHLRDKSVSPKAGTKEKAQSPK